MPDPKKRAPISFWELLRRIGKSPRHATMAAAGLVMIISGTLSFFFAKKPAEDVREQLTAEIEELKSVVRSYQQDVAEAHSQAKAIEAVIVNVSEEVRRVSRNLAALTTEEIASRIKRTETDLDSLQAIINPTNADEILTTARMRDEILARQKLEARVEAARNATDAQLDSVDGKLSALQYWIWGGLVAIIGGLFATLIAIFGYLGKKLTNLVIPAAPAAATETAPAPAQQPKEPESE